MQIEISVSVVIVSYQRPRWLRRCLSAVRQLDYTPFEIVVVACPEGCAVANSFESIRVVAFDAPNISKARNLGIHAARGDIIAFIDDDAVPEPTWLMHLARVFEDPNVSQAGGTTLGRNGISIQHGAALVDGSGTSFDVTVSSAKPITLEPDGALFPRLHGTNMAVRRDVLMRHGGFDTRFAFYLDETDLTYRLARAGEITKHVPNAVVHHASGESRVRRADRTPTNLFDIGASTAVFQSKHLEPEDREMAKDAFLAERDTWLLMHMQKGTLTPDDVARLKRELREGFAMGLTHPEHKEDVFEKSAMPLAPQRETRKPEDVYLIATGLRETETTARAAALVRDGCRVTIFAYGVHARFHTIWFTEDGYWLHRGGIYGREARNEPLWRRSTRHARVQQSLDRIAAVRTRSKQIYKK